MDDELVGVRPVWLEELRRARVIVEGRVMFGEVVLVVRPPRDEE